MKLGPNSKPHRGNAGYVCEMKAKLGGHIVIYRAAEAGISVDPGYAWVVMHEPSSLHVAVGSQAAARQVMKGVAKAKTLQEARQHADILPTVEDNADHEEPVDKVRRGDFVVSDAERAAALDRFMADPENEPSPEGKAALAKAFDIRRKS